MSVRKRPVATGTPERGELPHERVDQRLGLLGPSGRDPTRAAATRGVAVERELADDQRGAAGVEQRTIHRAGVVVEDPQVRDLRRELRGAARRRRRGSRRRGRRARRRSRRRPRPRRAPALRSPAVRGRARRYDAAFSAFGRVRCPSWRARSCARGAGTRPGRRSCSRRRPSRPATRRAAARARTRTRAATGAGPWR